MIFASNHDKEPGDDPVLVRPHHPAPNLVQDGVPIASVSHVQVYELESI
jgi:hypothetical protein